VTSPFLKKVSIKRWYEGLAQASAGERDFTFMNYGYVGDAPIELAPEDEQHRFAAQLYHQLVDQAPITGLDALEVGCGRGGGASFVMRTFRPRSLTAIDLSESVIDFCDRTHDVPGLRFEVGDAERLTFDDETFDVVFNVESSHGYGAMTRFVEGVTRVLRPGGKFLFTDMRPPDELRALRECLTEHGLSIVSERDITPNVVAALVDGTETDYRLRLGQKFVTEPFRAEYETFVGKKGTANHSRLADGGLTYLSMLLEKPC